MGKDITSSLKAFECKVVIFFSIVLIPIPEILEVIPGKNSATKVLLKPIISKLHPPLYELRTDMPIFDIIFKMP